MKKFQLIALNILALLFVVADGALIAQNFNFFLPKLTWMQLTFDGLPLGAVLLAGSLCAATAVGLKWGERRMMHHSQYQKTARELERKDVSREAAEGKVKALEQKVQTLEKALSEAIKVHK